MTKHAPGKTPSRARHPAIHAKLPSHSKPTHPRSVPVIASESDVEQLPDQPFAEGSHDAIDADLRHRMVSEAAYQLYAGRGYADGYDTDDWLLAEAEVDHLLLNPATSPTRAAKA